MTVDRRGSKTLIYPTMAKRGPSYNPNTPIAIAIDDVMVNMLRIGHLSKSKKYAAIGLDLGEPGSGRPGVSVETLYRWLAQGKASINPRTDAALDRLAAKTNINRDKLLGL